MNEQQIAELEATARHCHDEMIRTQERNKMLEWKLAEAERILAVLSLPYPDDDAEQLELLGGAR